VSTVTDRTAWLAERKKSIGASEAAAVCGVSEWDTALDIYLRKVGLAPDKPETEAMAWGTKLEGVIADAYGDRTGCGPMASQVFIRSARHPFMAATLDRLRADTRVVELKTVGWRSAAALGDQLGDDGSDVVPLTWRIQVTHQMIVAGPEFEAEADVAALIGGQELRIFTVPFDRRVADRMIELEAEFWGHVERRDPPPIDPTRDGQSIRLLYPEAVGQIDLDPAVDAMVQEWVRFKALCSEAKKEADKWRDQLMVEMGPFASGTLPDGRILCRKIVNRKQYSVAASSHPELSIVTPRKGK
jgi:putative phage-type endonuclease